MQEKAQDWPKIGDNSATTPEPPNSKAHAPPRPKSQTFNISNINKIGIGRKKETTANQPQNHFFPPINMNKIMHKLIKHNDMIINNPWLSTIPGVNDRKKGREKINKEVKAKLG